MTGSSAGGVATLFYADQVARRYRGARVIGLGDTAVERLRDRRMRRPLIGYNNLESTSFEDLREVLTEPRDRVRAGLDEGG